MPCKVNYKNHRPYYYYGKTIECSDVERYGYELVTFEGETYINYANGLCLLRPKRLNYKADESILVRLVPIASVFKQIKFVTNSSGNKIFGRKHSNENLVKMEMRRKDR